MTETAIQTMRPTSLLAKIAARYSVDPSKLMTTLKATAFKQKADAEPVTDEQMMALLIVADQYGLNPFTKEIYAYPDKQNGIVPVVSVDGWTRIVNEHEKFDGVEFEYGPPVKPSTHQGQVLAGFEFVTTKIHRKDRSHPISLTEYLDEVYRPPFEGKKRDGSGTFVVNGPWQTHTKRMHRHKSWIQCARLAFGFAGIYDEDEAQRIIERDITAQSTVVERTTLKEQVQRKSEAPAEATTINAAPAATDPPGEAAPGIESILQQVMDAKTDEDLDFARGTAKEHLKGSALKAVETAITNKAAELKEQQA
jgi:phage recombination protein Bet